MNVKKYVAYYRVSTDRQGDSRLGLEAQIEMVKKHVNGDEWVELAKFEEMESGKRSDRKRKMLRAALDLCEKEGATLVVAKMDRLTRNLGFLIRLLESNVPFVACDIPDLGNPASNRFVLQLMANVAEYEASMISQRTKAALAAKKVQLKARGLRLGSPNPAAGSNAGGEQVRQDANEFAIEVGPVLEELEKFGCVTLSKKKEGLEARGIKTAQEKKEWALSAIRNVSIRYNRLNGGST